MIIGFNVILVQGGFIMKPIFKSKRVWIAIVTVLLVVAIIISAVTVSSSNETRTVTKQLSLGEKYLSELNYEKAVVAYNKVIEIEPRNIQAYLGLAEAYVGLKQPEKAIEALETAISAIMEVKEDTGVIRENSEGIYIKLAELYEKNGEAEKAFRTLQEGYEATASAKIAELLERYYPAVKVSVPSGSYKEIQMVTLDSEGRKIHYSLDGSKPTKDSILYTEPIELGNGNMTLKVVSENGFGELGEVQVYSYSIEDIENEQKEHTDKLGNSQSNMQCFGMVCYDGNYIYYGTSTGIYKLDSSGNKIKMLSDEGACEYFCNAGDKIIYMKRIDKGETICDCYLCLLDKSTGESVVLLEFDNIYNAIILNSLGNKVYYNVENDNHTTTFVYDLETGKQEQYLDNGQLMTEKGIYYVIENESDNTIMFRSFKDNTDMEIIRIGAVPQIEMKNFLFLTGDEYNSVYRLDLGTKEYIRIIEKPLIYYVSEYGDDILWGDYHTINKSDINGKNTVELISTDIDSGNLAIPNLTNGKIALLSFDKDDLYFLNTDNTK